MNFAKKKMHVPLPQLEILAFTFNRKALNRAVESKEINKSSERFFFIKTSLLRREKGQIARWPDQGPHSAFSCQISREVDVIDSRKLISS